MSSKIWLINIALATVIVVFGIMSVDVWTKNDRVIPEDRAVKEPGAPLADKRIIKRTMPVEATYEIVAEKDLFSPDRSEYLPEDSSKPALPDISEKQIFLYGVVMMGGKKQALVRSPESGPAAAGGQPEDKWVKVGDTIGNLRVAAIEKEKIVLAEGADRHEIFLHDENKPAGRQTSGTQQSATPTVVVSGSAPAPAAPAAASGAGTSASTPKPAPASGAAAGKNKPVEDGYEIVNTPFGPIKRRIK